MLSVVIPVFNEGRNLKKFIGELAGVLGNLKTEYEMLAVDDGSTDDTGAILSTLKSKFKNLKVMTLRRNFGKSVCYMVGFSASVGDIVVTIDSDGQDVPGNIPKLLTAVKNGSDVAVGWRKNRADSASKIFASYLWNGFLRLTSGSRLHDVNSGLKAFRKTVLSEKFYRGDFHRYLPVILDMEGYKVTEVEVSHRKRELGNSKYTMKRIYPAVFDFLTTMFLSRYGHKPMHFFGPYGLGIFAIGMVINIYLIALKILGESIGGRPLLIFGVLLTIAGLQLIFTGFLGDLISRESDNRAGDYLKKAN